MLVHHRYSAEEVGLATGLSADEVAAAVERFKIKPGAEKERVANDRLLVLPYPGGRHPRIGFLDGAVGMEARGRRLAGGAEAAQYSGVWHARSAGAGRGEDGKLVNERDRQDLAGPGGSELRHVERAARL